MTSPHLERTVESDTSLRFAPLALATINEICDRFEVAWRDGQKPSIAEFLDQCTFEEYVRRDLLVELIVLDLHYRWRKSGQVTIDIDAPAEETIDSGRKNPKVKRENDQASKPARLRLDFYAAKFPLLGPPETFPDILITAEFREREAAGDNPDREDYLRRFPTQRDALAEFFQEFDAQQASQDSDAAIAWSHDQPDGCFGDYELLDEIARGGMGVVYKARHRRMKRLVAVKMILAKASTDPDAVRRFYQEIEAAAKLNHPNIVDAYDASEYNGTNFLVMEYVAGKDMATIVKSRGPVDVPTAVDWMLQAARGLQYAHEQGVVHRDIKPSNLLVDRNGTVKILDMGLARLSGLAGNRRRNRLTFSGQVMGTCDYMAPEQAADSSRADPRSDIYSLGCTLYRLLTGHVLYRGETFMEVCVAHHDSPIPSLLIARSDVPQQLDAVYRKMVAKRPDERQQSMNEVIAGLEAVANALPRQPVIAGASKSSRAVEVGQSVVLLKEATKVGRSNKERPVTIADEITKSYIRPDETMPALLAKTRKAMARGRRWPLLFALLLGGAVVLTIVLGMLVAMFLQR